MIGRHAEVGDQIRRQYKHFVVDEYQDVSPLQQFVLDQWLGGRQELCVVGDPAQTIYSFAGASPRHLLDFRREYPDAAVVRLVRDYRSTPQVVALANALTKGRGGAFSSVELVAQRPNGPAPAYTAYDDDVAEAEGVAARIDALTAQGMPPREIAVLYRTNSQSEALEEALAARGIGYLVRGGQRFFDRDEIKRAIVLLRGAAVGASSAPSDAGLGEAVRSVLVDAGWAEQAPAARGAVRERWEALQALAELADDVDAAAAGEATMREFVEHIAERAQAQHAPSVDGVTLTTMHAAKGLEWDAVFIVGCSEGLMPISLAETAEAVEEEKRLLYVAITRARELISISFARARKTGGKATRKRTRFLEQQWPDARPSSVKRQPTSAKLAELDAGQVRLFEELKEWRLGIAKETSKPAFTVLVDVSLVQIARDRPRTIGDLARVNGIGASKLENYGADILEIVGKH